MQEQCVCSLGFSFYAALCVCVCVHALSVGLLQAHARLHSHPQEGASWLFCGADGPFYLSDRSAERGLPSAGVIPSALRVQLGSRRCHRVCLLRPHGRWDVEFMSHSVVGCEGEFPLLHPSGVEILQTRRWIECILSYHLTQDQFQLVPLVWSQSELFITISMFFCLFMCYFHLQFINVAHYALHSLERINHGAMVTETS